MGSQDISCYVFNSRSYESVRVVINVTKDVMTGWFVVLEMEVAMVVG